MHAPSQTNWSVIVALIASTGVFGLTLGMTYPLLSLVLERRGVGATAIGLNGAMTGAGVVLSTLSLPWLMARLGTLVTALLALVGTAATILVLGATESLLVWHGLRIGLGFCLNIPFVIAESLINTVAGRATRGRAVAGFTAFGAVGFAVGPALLALTGTDGRQPFYLCAAIIFLAALPMLGLARRGDAVRLQAPHTLAVLAFVVRAPLLAAAAGLYAFYDTVVLVLMPIYALEKGLPAEVVPLTIGAFLAGCIALQPVIGLLSDRQPELRILTACALISAALCVVVPWTWEMPAVLWPTLFLLGGACYGLYTVALTQLGHRFQGSALVSGSAAFALLYGFSGMAGPFASGAVMTALGGDAVQWLMAAAFLALAIGGLWAQPSAQARTSTVASDKR